MITINNKKKVTNREAGKTENLLLDYLEQATGHLVDILNICKIKFQLSPLIRVVSSPKRHG